MLNRYQNSQTYVSSCLAIYRIGPPGRAAASMLLCATRRHAVSPAAIACRHAAGRLSRASNPHEAPEGKWPAPVV